MEYQSGSEESHILAAALVDELGQVTARGVLHGDRQVVLR